ncbi:hypothetical protein DFR86_01900 [Acidianus sulfidivorans JP7]|uniref:Sodium:calcium antiporter n=1 Tax=Acidianus sulfidivorans JP7 TaxID=619593 RepID=A0A2U9IK60_9CREN|nr:hypothetical protein [Acidianus sulfidivorans]AWR96421.1 hypothetical protein DFR86_01900 [Acidianus sulfidivorans JP7]
MYYYELIVLLLLSLVGFYLGGDIIGRSGRKILGHGFIVGIISAFPELLVITTLLMSKEYYLALSSVFTTALTIYSIGISLVSITVFLKWKKSQITISDFQIQEKPIIISIIGIIISIFIIHEINIVIGIFSMFIFAYYLVKKVSNVHLMLKDIGLFAVGMIVLWLSSEAFVVSSSVLFPQWIFSIFLLPIALNIQDIIVAIKGSLRSPEISSQMTLSFLVESIVISSFVFGLIGIADISGLYLDISYPLIALLISNIVVLLLFSHNNISIRESIILLMMYILVPLSTAFHI